MPKFERLYYVKAKVTVEVVLHVAANDDNEAFGRAMDGAWHNVNPNWNSGKVTHIGEIIAGPKIN